MSEAAIYFPYISVPQNAWFSRVLLYWDEIGSIVPSGFALYPDDRLSPYMAELVKADLVTPIVPEQYMGELSLAMKPFLSYLDQDPDIVARSRRGLGFQPASRGAVSPGTIIAQIHSGKFGGYVGGELIERGLARWTGYEWYEVESKTASAFMLHLAVALGDCTGRHMDPITDQTTNLAVLASSEARTEGLRFADDIRMSVLEAVLPAPSAAIKVNQLADFKQRHGDELRAFRRRVEGELIALASIADSGLREARMRVIKDELDAEAREIQAQMRMRGWQRIEFGSVCGVGATALAAGAAAHGEPVIQAAAGGLLLLKALYDVRKQFRGHQQYLKHPLAYAALARESLMVR
jgi:hypothetical protein